MQQRRADLVVRGHHHHPSRQFRCGFPDFRHFNAVRGIAFVDDQDVGEHHLFLFEVIVACAEQLAAIRRRYPDARLMLYLKKGASLAREMEWLGSHRYAVLNLGGASRQNLHDRYPDIRRRLAFD